jgi:16S rRNA processing protein RimM
MSRAGVYPMQTNAAGSPLPGEPVYLAVGKLRHAHGVHGEMLVEVLTDFPERLQPGTVLYLEAEVKQLRLVKSRPHREGLLMTFEGYSTPEEVSKFRNQTIFVKSEDRPALANGEYYHHQLIGLQVITHEGKLLGMVTEILETGASDVLVIRADTGVETLIPVVDAFIQEIDLTKREITVHLIPGMLSEEP